MKKWLAFIACMAVASLNVWAQGEPTAFSLNPAVNRAQAGTTFSVDLRLTTAQALFKATARVASNNPKVTIKDVVFPAYPDNVATKKTVISNTERIVGAETMFTKLFDAGFDGVIATVVFEVAHDANADETAALTLSVDRYQTANVGCYAVATSQKLASALNNAALTVVQFNAPPLAGAATEDAAEPTVLTPVFTGDGASAAGGVISGVFFDYPEGGDEATHGAFAVSADKKSILYTAPTRVGNIRPFDVVAIYAAHSGDLVDRNTVTVTVAPVNDPPEVAFVPPVNVNENDPIVFTITVVDEENGDFDFVVYWLDGNDWIKVPGNWAGLTFTSAEAPGYDAVMHPNLAKEVILKVEAIDRYDNQSTESAPTPATIHDVDQPVGAPTNVAITPDPAYTTSELNVNFTDAVDPDPEDAVNYTYKWTNDKNATTLDTRTVPPGMAKKDETWTVVVTANSFNGDRKDSDPAQITISNSLPIVDDGELFIQKGDNLPKSKDIDLAELAGDRDGQEDITEIVIVTLPAKGTLALKDGTVYTYTVDGDDEFFGENVDIFEFRAKDASGGESIEIAKVAVTYRALPFCRRADGGAFNEQPIDHHNYTVFAMPGDIIQGTAWVEVNNTLPAEEKVTLVGTVTWGDRTTQYWDTKVLPVGESFQSVSLGYQVPDAPGDYYILIGYAKSDAVPQFMSSTHAGRDAVWNDGNDLGFDWNEGQFEQALSNEGRVTANILQLDGQFKEEQVPVTAIHIRVTSEVNVTFVVDQGDEAPVPESKTVTIGAPYGDLPFSSREGHRFLGWWTAREGGSEVTPETIVTVKANHSLYAQWAVESYTLTFDSAGGSDVDPITQEYNTIVTPPADPTREGHTFDGWEPAVPKTMPAADMTLTALWTPIQYIVTFELGNCGYRTGGGELEQLINHGDSATAPIVTTYDGWEFIGWDKDFTKIVEPTEIQAQYQPKKYAVT
ncbi:MAG TPA: InlB B-repeat-containing protein, partial [Lentisphaeria bacterium]|nr:InlB B-repeat-containing protein [Lentisphaeria bacterium]